MGTAVEDFGIDRSASIIAMPEEVPNTKSKKFIATFCVSIEALERDRVPSGPTELMFSELGTTAEVVLSHKSEALKVSVQRALPEGPQTELPLKVKFDRLTTTISSAWAVPGAARAIKPNTAASVYFVVFMVPPWGDGLNPEKETPL